MNRDKINNNNRREKKNFLQKECEQIEVIARICVKFCRIVLFMKETSIKRERDSVLSPPPNVQKDIPRYEDTFLELGGGGIRGKSPNLNIWGGGLLEL